MVSTDNTSPQTSKRKGVQCDDGCHPPTFKKAKFQWQVKNVNNDKSVSSLELGKERTDSQNVTREKCTQSEVYCSSSASCHKMMDEDNINTQKADCTHTRHTLSKEVHPCLKCMIGNCSSHKSEEQKTKEILRKLKMDSYLSHRQNQHVAKAVVDNAINRTLEELGMCYDPGIEDVPSCDRVVSTGISQAILTQGLEFIPPDLDQEGLKMEKANKQGVATAVQEETATSFMKDQFSELNSTNGDLIDLSISMVISSQGLKRIEKGANSSKSVFPN